MNLKKLLAVLMAAAMMLSLCACGGNNETTEPTAAPETTEATAAPETTEATDATDAPETEPEGNVYKVTVLDEAGNPVVGAMVQLCFETCMPAMTNENGVAEYRVDEADYKVSFLMIPEGFAEDMGEYHFEEGSYEMTLTLKAAE